MSIGSGAIGETAIGETLAFGGVTVLLDSIVIVLALTPAVATGGADVGLDGIAIELAASSPAATGGADVGLDGIGIEVAAGSAVATGGADVALDGIAIGVEAASVTVTGGALVALSGIAIDMATGDVVASGGTDVPLDGIAIALRLNSVDVITVTPGFFDLVRRADGAGQYLVEVAMLPAGAATITAGGTPGAVGELALGESGEGAGLDFGETLHQLSDREWVGAPDDSQKPNIWYDARVKTPLVLERAVPLQPEEPRRAARQYGFIEIENRDGGWDGVVNANTIDGREIRVLYGPYMAPYRDFHPIGNVLGDRFEASAQSVRIMVRDRALPLDRVLQKETYGGTGGADGTAEMTGKHKPLALGCPFNVSPPLIEPFLLIYQWHYRSAEGVSAVYDRGLALTRDTSIGSAGDVADYTALAAADIAAGHFITCRALGLFRLGSSPTGAITADVKGDRLSGVFTDTVSGVAWRLATSIGDINPARANKPSFDTLPAYRCGVWLSTEDAARKTGAEVLGEVLGSVGAYWDVSQAGFVRAFRHAAPQTQGAQHWIDPADIINVEPEPSPPIRYRNPVGFARNWTLQRGSEISSDVSDDRRQVLADPQRVAGKAVENLAILTAQPEAFNPPVWPSLLIDEADADAVAADGMALHGTPRRRYRVTLPRVGYLIDLSEVVSLSWPRHGLGQRRNWRVLGIRNDADRDTIVIRVWG
ncbi:hypothetical protein [Parvibaculum sp.]|uniref:hypothetical protein n=1 Tax=Parvibaculum sp. TaxID=2024848 RepID=UPI001DFD83F2|nr:hypothetical protein [Parvibaculum sp.]MBX3490912.1 hypothetical protein [Parvibaculum sp.]